MFQSTEKPKKSVKNDFVSEGRVQKAGKNGSRKTIFFIHS